MSDYAIRVENVSKSYRIYDQRFYKVLDALGVPVGKHVRELAALRDVTIGVPRGMRLGIVGRNGAGKSTLLKMIANTIRPTSGRIEVNGRVTALLEMGTGFHPDFTGKENIFASLSYMGVVGKAAQAKFEDIVEFSELEEFIDQPLKTYSSGMYARLAFSVATAIEPEVLIIDEILGAGDAYFVAKCQERMKRLTAGGVTLLFVSHDLSSLQKMCDRAVWLERGRLIMEGDSLAVGKAYMKSIREQEEVRLKARSLRLQRKTVSSIVKDSDIEQPVVFHLITPEWTTPKQSHPIHKLTLLDKNLKLGEIMVGDALDNDPMQPHHVLDGIGFMEWSEPRQVGDRYVRAFEHCKGQYKHAPFQFTVPKHLPPDEQLTLQIEYLDKTREPLAVQGYDGQQYVRLGLVESTGDGAWKIASFEFPPLWNPQVSPSDYPDNADAIGRDGPLTRQAINTVDEYGDGDVVITKVEMLDSEGKERRIFTVGDTLRFRTRFATRVAIRDPVFVVAIYALDGTCVNQVISSVDGVSTGIVDGTGLMEVRYDDLRVGRGKYLVSVGILRTVDPLWRGEQPAYCIHDRRYELVIEQPSEVQVEQGLCVHAVEWNLKVDDVSDDPGLDQAYKAEQEVNS